MAQCEIIAISNQKDGVGKTTTTFNLGAALASQGKKVLLIDADPQGNLTTYMGWTEDEIPVTLNEVLLNTLSDKKTDFEKCIKHHNENLDLIPSDIQLSSIEMTLVRAMSREYTLRHSIQSIKDQYDYILIDTQPSLGMLPINALACADKVIIPVQPQYLAAKGMTQLLSTIIKIRQQINPNLKIDGIVLTIVDKRANLTKDIYNQLQENYGSAVRIYDTQIPRAIKVAESTAHGKSIFTYDKSSKVAEAYSSLANEVLIDGKERKKMQIPKIKLDDLFSTQEQRDNAKLEKIVDIKIDCIDDFPNHPFKIIDNEEMEQMKESIADNGVLIPALVRPKPDGRYEMISGHRRKFASQLAFKETMPCIVRELSDDEAIIIMVDSNMQREEILPSEKAFAYKMK